MRRRSLAPIAVALSAALASLSFAAAAHAVPVVPTGFAEEILVTGLDQPNSFAFLPDGRLLFTEQKTGNIRVVLSSFTLVPTPAYTVPDITIDNTERGLQGIAVDPRWPAFPYVYVVYTRVGAQEWIVRLTASGSLTDPLGTNLSLSDPLILIRDIRDLLGNHNGGTLRFGPDEHLYVTLGEDSHACASQQPDSLLGKLLRLDVTRLPAGGGGPVPRALLIPADNPLSGADSNASLVYAYGLRNPWRMHIDSETGTVYVADVGWDNVEEINEVVPGSNYGWPWREGNQPQTTPISGCTDPGGTYAEPILSLDHETTNYIAIQTATVYRPVPSGTSNWPMEYWGNLFMGDYYQSRMRRLVKTAGTWGYAPPVAGQPTTEEWSGLMFWAVDFLIGPDGSMYWLKAWDDSFRPSSGMIRRIRWQSGSADVEPTRPVATSGLSSAPNPFARHVELSGAFPSGARVRTVVFDAAGRRVREGVAREAGPGHHVWTWDGHDDHGVPVPAGIYLARFESGSVALTGRVLRVQ
jgi:glucose/arabinose dehydrogenase